MQATEYQQSYDAEESQDWVQEQCYGGGWGGQYAGSVEEEEQYGYEDISSQVR